MANISPRPALPVNVPINYPTTPTPGKIQILFDANKRDLYHKLSPYGYDTFLGITTRQPFHYVYPDEAKGSTNLYIVDLMQKSITDVKRVAKFMISQNGIIFMGKQFLLQTGNAFNETRIWNPTSPIVAAAMPLTLWTARPQRHIDTGDLLGSFLGGLGKTIGGIFGSGNSPPKPPAGTVGAIGLPTNNAWGGKGLLRAGTANKGKTRLTNKWEVQKSGNLGAGKYLSNVVKEVFGNFIPARQGKTVHRSDEITYGLMLGSDIGENGPFTYRGPNGEIREFRQFWFGGTTAVMRREGRAQPLNRTRLYRGPDGESIFLSPSGNYKVNQQYVGYAPNTDKEVKYGYHVGRYLGSDVLIQYSMYLDEANKYPTKVTEKQDPSVLEMRDSLNRVITKLRSRLTPRSTQKTYTVNTPKEASVVSFNQAKIGYDRIAARTKVSPEYKTLNDYRKNVRVLEDAHTENPVAFSLKMASSHQSDYINNLLVLSGENVRNKEWKAWKPYRDDLIAFYFYDVVNDRYIPFRATVRGLQETDSANWEELSFIGRADRLYSYSGFNRSLTFSFTVHINSILELAPTWQRINYLMSLVKPASYTSAPTNQNLNLPARFMIPPMVMVTIGDMYRNQPIVIGSAGLAIPDTALWETLNADNSDEWSYLANYIKSPKIGKKYGQLPKTIDISINAYVLEKERAIVGAAHFGHAPHKEEYEVNKYRTTLPDYSVASELSKELVVYNGVSAPKKS